MHKSKIINNILRRHNLEKQDFVNKSKLTNTEIFEALKKNHLTYNEAVATLEICKVILLDAQRQSFV